MAAVDVENKNRVVIEIPLAGSSIYASDEDADSTADTTGGGSDKVNIPKQSSSFSSSGGITKVLGGSSSNSSSSSSSGASTEISGGVKTPTTGGQHKVTPPAPSTAVSSPSVVPIPTSSGSAAVAAPNTQIDNALSLDSIKEPAKLAKVDIFASYRYGYETTLSGREKTIYKEILKQMTDFKQSKISTWMNVRPILTITLKTPATMEELIKITKVLWNDSPELFHMPMSAPRATKYSGGKISEFYNFVYNTYEKSETYKNKLKEVEEKAAPIIAKALSATTEKEKARIIHDELLKVVSYGGFSALTGGDIVGALVNGRVVCEGYARAYLYLAQRVGLKAVYTDGFIPDNGKYGPHAWNYIAVDGLWYGVDPTWDDGMTPYSTNFSHRYFLKGLSEFSKDHFHKAPSTGEVRQSYSVMPIVSPNDHAYSIAINKTAK